MKNIQSTEPIVEDSRNIPPGTAALRRISWGAVFAGTILALAIQLALSMLGLGIGMGILDPYDASPGQGLGIGSIIWLLVSTIISLFIGGWVAAKLAGIPRTTESVMHGLLTWSLFTLVSLYLLTTVIGGVIGGVAGITGRILSLAGQNIESVGPRIAQELEDRDILDKARERVQDEETREEAEFQARRTADDVARLISRTGIYSFIAMLIGLIAAAVGGRAGLPQEVIRTTSS
jgi:hypothetical protein